MHEPVIDDNRFKDMTPYTIPEFAERHGLTLSQCKLASSRRRLDTVLCRNVEKKRGGAKRFYLVYETQKTLDQVKRLKTINRIGHNVDTGTKLQRYESMIYSYNH